MFFIGQTHIVKQLDLSLKHMDETKEGGAFLLRGMSGYGKTALAFKMCNYLAGSKYCLYLGSTFSVDKFREDVWVHFIDEIHTLDKQEPLFPLIDSGKYVFVFATNHDSILQEALVNRCTQLLFVDYTDQELVQIFNKHCKFSIPQPVIEHIIDIAGRNPRIIVKTYARNLYMYYLNKRNELDSPIAEMIEKVNQLHGIENGLNKVCNMYLEVLKALGGKASIKLISSTIRLDQNTLQFEIEPVLIYKKKIKITNKGRELCL